MIMHESLSAAPAAARYLPDVHPARSQARVLLTSVFGPYAVDDEHGSRVLTNPSIISFNSFCACSGKSLILLPLHDRYAANQHSDEGDDA